MEVFNSKFSIKVSGFHWGFLGGFFWLTGWLRGFFVTMRTRIFVRVWEYIDLRTQAIM